jgi:hypothetical protein
MPTITTTFGPIEALPGVEFFPDGSVRSCRAARACPLDTLIGTLVPQFNANTLRKRQLPAILFHPNGMIRNLPLEEQVMVPTPLGPLPAEQVTFHDSGALKRVFPLNGALNGYWTQEDELWLAVPMDLETPAGPVRAMILSLYFSPCGSLRSLTLWPGQTIDVPSPLGSVTARIGVSFFDSGAIRSLEPAAPWAVPTPVGEVLAWNPDAIGISGDANSLRFRENGGLLGLMTATNSFDVTLENGRMRRVSPPLRRQPCDAGRMEAGPLALEFGGGVAAFTASNLPRLSVAAAGVAETGFFPPLPSLSVSCAMGGGKW